MASSCCSLGCSKPTLIFIQDFSTSCRMFNNGKHCQNLITTLLLHSVDSHITTNGCNTSRNSPEYNWSFHASSLFSFRYTHDIEACSCDELLVDITTVLEDTGATPLEFAQVVREEIYEKTRCTASAGIG